MTKVKKNIHRRIRVVRNDSYLMDLFEQKLFEIINSNNTQEFKQNKMQLDYLKKEIIRRMENNN